MRFQVYQDGSGQWRWRLLAANGKVIADSGEAYTRKRDCERAVLLVVEGVAILADRHVRAQIEPWAPVDEDRDSTPVDEPELGGEG